MEGAGAGRGCGPRDELSGGRRGQPGSAVPWLWAALVLCGSSPLLAQGPPSILVDRVAVVVEGPSARDRVSQVATMWDVFVAAHIQLIRKMGPLALERWCDAAAFGEAQQRIVEELIVLREAVRLGRNTIPPGVVDEARDRLAVSLGGHDVLRAFLRQRSISTESVDAALRREAIVARFTRDSVRLPVTLEAAELEARFNAGGHPFEGREFAEASEEFREWLRMQQLEEHRQRWLVMLRGRCRVIINNVANELAPGGSEEGG